ncbi:hypothetical protein [Paludibacterium paludis]|uniref:Transmembrane protein n=1 Tax=Paludibacterium paludis TaxID=1225769 RepID=A0A918UA62_9NEIS|nr:hypothetical protein [Paludibacterium paludis]GGY15479.1 hypothetical protein GCM10011289_18410 [Paludibacterium paludis]
MKSLSAEESDVWSARRRDGRLLLVLLTLLCLAPVLAAWWVIRAEPPRGGKSYGTLLTVRPFEAARLAGWPTGKWVLLTREGPDCATACRSLRHTVGQIRTALGEAASRTVVVRLVDGRAARADAGELAGAGVPLPAVDSGFMLVDPLGNQVMFYPASAEPRRVMGEIGHLLKTNNGLG